MVERSAFVVPVAQSAILRGRDTSSTTVDAIPVHVDTRPEPVDSTRFESFRHVVGGFGRRSHRRGMLVEDPLSEDVTHAPPLTRKCVR